MIKLKLIGYWRSEEELEWPDPACFVDENMDNLEKEVVVEYLKKGLFMPHASGGISWCRFRCEEIFEGSGEQTDGVFVWPENLWHYVDKHKVRLPAEFINHVKNNNPIPTAIKDEYEILSEWWLGQKGFNRNARSFLMEDSHGEINILFSDDLPLVKRIGFLRKLDLYKNTSMTGLKTLSQSSSACFTCKWTDYRRILDFKIEGIKITFKGK